MAGVIYSIFTIYTCLQNLSRLSRRCNSKSRPPTSSLWLRACGFLRRQSRKVNPGNFLLTTCLFGLQNRCSLASFAQVWASLTGQCLSKQAVKKRFGGRAVLFLQGVLQSVLASTLTDKLLPCRARLAGFNRILLQDSTCLKLPAKLAGLFPGPANQTRSELASLKIQATLDLRKNQWVSFQLTPFIVNDQRAAPEILAPLQATDLVIRDLGYFVLEVFKQIHEKGAYFLSRFRYGLAVALPASQGRVSLLQTLQQSGPLWDQPVLLGAEKLPVRLIAVRLPPKQVAERRRKARRDRDRRLNHSQDYFQLLAWNIFVTNVPASLLDATTLIQLYTLRWRIETVFKAWKSHFQLQALTEVSAEQLLIVILGKLIWICWFSVHWTELTASGQNISLLKLADWWAKFAIALLMNPQNASHSFLLTHLIYYCRYEKRKDRKNFLQKCAALGCRAYARLRDRRGSRPYLG